MMEIVKRGQEVRCNIFIRQFDMTGEEFSVTVSCGASRRRVVVEIPKSSMDWDMDGWHFFLPTDDLSGLVTARCRWNGREDSQALFFIPTSRRPQMLCYEDDEDHDVSYTIVIP